MASIDKTLDTESIGTVRRPFESFSSLHQTGYVFVWGSVSHSASAVRSAIGPLRHTSSGTRYQYQKTSAWSF
jgi:hypothetical protein